MGKPLNINIAIEIKKINGNKIINKVEEIIKSKSLNKNIGISNLYIIFNFIY